MEKILGIKLGRSNQRDSVSEEDGRGGEANAPSKTEELKEGIGPEGEADNAGSVPLF